MSSKDTKYNFELPLIIKNTKSVENKSISGVEKKRKSNDWWIFDPQKDKLPVFRWHW